jgi:dephospho-CoA kinase
MPSKGHSDKVLIGITGGIGSGKSLAAHYFELLGYKVINADAFTRELYRTNPELKEKLVGAFGKEILDENGFVSGAKARSIIFADSDSIKRVNSIVHPFVIDAISKEVLKLKGEIVFIESAIAYESGFYKNLDYVIMVYSPDNLRIQRVAKRDGAKEEDILKLMKLQMPEKEKMERADFVLLNEGKKIDMKRAVKELVKQIEKKIEERLKVNG